MCVGGTPDVPAAPERQAARNPGGDPRMRLLDRDRRRRGYAAAMIAAAGGPAATTNITGV